MIYWVEKTGKRVRAPPPCPPLPPFPSRLTRLQQRPQSRIQLFLQVGRRTRGSCVPSPPGGTPPSTSTQNRQVGVDSTAAVTAVTASTSAVGHDGREELVGALYTASLASRRRVGESEGHH